MDVWIIGLIIAFLGVYSFLIYALFYACYINGKNTQEKIDAKINQITTYKQLMQDTQNKAATYKKLMQNTENTAKQYKKALKEKKKGYKTLQKKYSCLEAENQCLRAKLCKEEKND